MNELIDPSDDVARAVLELLRRLPLKWQELNVDALTAVEQNALKLLTCAGLVERRFALRLSLLGHPVCIEATLTATGEYGFTEAGEPVAQAAWEAWAETYAAQKHRAEGPPPRFHCEKMAPQMARLTDQGQIALKDLREGRNRMALDFVLRRGPVFTGITVPGEGRAERIRTAPASPASVNVKVTNLPEVAGPLAAIAETVKKMFENRATASNGGAPQESRDASPRAQWPLPRTEQAVRDYLQRHQAQYKELGQACLNGRADATAEFCDVFGPTAIARGINELLQITDRRAECRRQDVSRTQAYQKLVRPFLASAPEPPEGWVSTDDSGSAFHDILDDIHGAEDA